MNESFLSVGIIAVIAIIALGGLVLWIWSLIHCIRNRYLSENNRLIGIILIVVLGLIGRVVYLFLPREPNAQR